MHSIFNCIIELWKCFVIKCKLHEFAVEHAGMKLMEIGMHTKVHEEICKKCVWRTKFQQTVNIVIRHKDCWIARSLARKRNNRLCSRPESMTVLIKLTSYAPHKVNLKNTSSNCHCCKILSGLHRIANCW